MLITAVYPAYIEATSVHRKDARWCGCASEFDGMGLPQENLEAGKDVSPARGNFPPVPGKDAATIKRATNLNIDGNGKKGGGAGANKGPTAKQGHLMAEFMSRRQTLLAQHRSLRVLPANRTVVEQSELNPMGFPAQPRRTRRTRRSRALRCGRRRTLRGASMPRRSSSTGRGARARVAAQPR